MKPHPRNRKTIKRGGAMATVLVGVVAGALALLGIVLARAGLEVASATFPPRIHVAVLVGANSDVDTSNEPWEMIICPALGPHEAGEVWWSTMSEVRSRVFGLPWRVVHIVDWNTRAVDANDVHDRRTFSNDGAFLARVVPTLRQRWPEDAELLSRAPSQPSRFQTTTVLRQTATSIVTLALSVGLLALFVARIAAHWMEYRHRRARINHCPKCNYDRAGIAADAKCPECGAAPTSV